MLRVTLVGNLGNDPEARFSQAGKEIVNLSVAVNQVRKNPDGERTESTEWMRVKVSGYQVEYVKKLTKGSRVLVMGRLDISHYTGRDGDARTGFDVWADEVQGMSVRERGQNGDGDDREPAGAAAAPAGGGRKQADEDASDLNDLPF